MAPGSSSKQRDYDYLFKLVLIGDSGVGKSCLLLRFAVRQKSGAAVVPMYAHTHPDGLLTPNARLFSSSNRTMPLRNPTFPPLA